MERIINTLYEIEEKANNIVKRVNEEKIRIQEEFDHALVELDKNIATEQVEKLSVLKADIDKTLAMEKQSLIDDCNKQLSKMEEKYSKNHESLVNTIFQEIISPK